MLDLFLTMTCAKNYLYIFFPSVVDIWPL